MEWNNAMNLSKFKKEQAKLRKEYLAAGMTEEQIKELYEFDLEEYRRSRIEAMHTQELDFDSEDFDDKETDNPLFKKYLEAISVTMDYSDSSRYSWIEEIENPQLATALKRLSEDDLEIITELVVDNLSQREIAKKRGVKEAAVSRKIGRLKDFLKNFST